jgi:hypothetical protein
MKPEGWVTHPDEVERLIANWQESYKDFLTVNYVEQFTGRRVYALTVSERTAKNDKLAVLFHKPHAHEPAPCAAMMNVVAKLLSGQGLDGEKCPMKRETLLASLALTFLPDANPHGSQRAPVQWWDGTQFTNDEFWVWMRGLDPETGKMWHRYDKWDMREVEPKPASVGIVYEQVSEHEYVEPNRHHDSSLFKLLFGLLQECEYSFVIDLHQTEFVGQIENCMAILPIAYDEQPEHIQKHELEVAQNMLQWWRKWGGTPVAEVKPLGYSGAQAEYFRRAWGEIYAQLPCVTSEVRNNSVLCPPSQQRALSEAAIWAAIETALAWQG